MTNYEKIMELKTKIITLLELEIELVNKRVSLEEECRKLEKENL